MVLCSRLLVEIKDNSSQRYQAFRAESVQKREFEITHLKIPQFFPKNCFPFCELLSLFFRNQFDVSVNIFRDHFEIKVHDRFAANNQENFAIDFSDDFAINFFDHFATDFLNRFATNFAFDFCNNMREKNPTMRLLSCHFESRKNLPDASF